MKTYKTFRNVNQVINEVSYIAFQVAEISESCLVISDSKIDAELLRNSTPAQRAAGMTIFIREHGTQFAHAEDVAEVRAAWGPQIVRTIEISKERGGLWVVALDCATRYDRNGEPVETTTQSKKITAAQAREVATMAMRCAVLTQSATDIKAAELARREADRLEEIATRAEVADEMAQRRAELEALEAEQTNEGENEPQTTNTPQSDRNAATAELFAVSLEVVECLRDIETLTPEEAADKYPAGLLAQAEQLGQLEEWAEQSNPHFDRDRPTGTRAEMVETLQRFNPGTMARAAV